jgi:cytochrome c-type biogenesis protein CcmF
MVGRYELALQGARTRKGSNFAELLVDFAVKEDGRTIATVSPAKRTFAHREMATTEAALMRHGFGQLYVSLGDVAENGTIAVRAYDKPLVLLIWIGTLVMAVGGALSLSDRRLRVGAPRPSRAKLGLQPAE